MSEYTKGPWAVELWTDYVLVRSADGGPSLFFESLSHEGAIEDARLIAAAPELLEALVEAVSCGMVPITSVSDGGAATHSRQVRCADQIRAAIAKATGESA